VEKSLTVSQNVNHGAITLLINSSCGCAPKREENLFAQKLVQGAGGVAQVIDFLPHKHETLSLKPQYH
jgi:hypothetical protein